MTVSELIAQLQECNPNAEVESINGLEEFSEAEVYVKRPDLVRICGG